MYFVQRLERWWWQLFWQLCRQRMPVEVTAGVMADIAVTLVGMLSEDMPRPAMLEAGHAGFRARGGRGHYVARAARGHARYAGRAYNWNGGRRWGGNYWYPSYGYSRVGYYGLGYGYPYYGSGYYGYRYGGYYPYYGNWGYYPYLYGYWPSVTFSFGY